MPNLLFAVYLWMFFSDNYLRVKAVHASGSQQSQPFDSLNISSSPPEYVTVFESMNTQEGPYPCTRIPAALALPGNIILAFAECRKWVGDGCYIKGYKNNTSLQYFNRSICLKRSLDGGKTWEQLQDNITQRYSANPSALYDEPRNRTLLVFNDAKSKQMYMISSHDKGVTWDLPAKEVKDNVTGDIFSRVGGPGNSVAVLPDGVLLAAVYATNRSLPDRNASWTNASVLRSSDGGESWTEVHVIPHLGEPSLTVLPHDVKGVGPVVILDARCPDGRYPYPGPTSPCDCNCRGVATSTNGGVTWGATFYDPSVPDPNCQGAVLALSNGSVAFSNPDAADKRRNPSVRLGDVLVRCEEDAVVVWNEEAQQLATSQTFGAYSSMFETVEGRIGILWETEGDQAARGCTGGSCSIVLSIVQ